MVIPEEMTAAEKESAEEGAVSAGGTSEAGVQPEADAAQGMGGSADASELTRGSRRRPERPARPWGSRERPTASTGIPTGARNRRRTDREQSQVPCRRSIKSI